MKGNHQPMKYTRVLLLGISWALAICGPTNAEDIDIDAGRTFAEQNCARCHATGRDDESKLSIAPPLRTISSKYPLENLDEAFAEGIVTGHNDMPEFRLKPSEINNLLGYIQSISP